MIVVGSHPTTASADGVDVATVTDVDGRYRHVGSTCRRFLGWDPSQMVGRARLEFTHPDDVLLHRYHTRLAPGRTITVVYRFRRGDGSFMWIEERSRLVPDEDGGSVASSIRVLGERDQPTLGSRPRAFTDPLTGLANRTLLMDRLNTALRRVDRETGAVAVMYVDVDRFNVFNDALGHRAGDAVLMKTAARIAAHLPPGDTLARFAADEFVVVAEGLSGEREAIDLCERILVACREPVEVEGEEVIASVSIGMTATADARYGADELLREANLALYRAKERGRDRVEVFDEELRTRAVGRLGIERVLRSAIAEDRVVVEYQPVVDLLTGRVVSTEALVRIRDGEQTMLLPDAFLEVAADIGLLLNLDRVVQAEAVRQAAAWNERLGGSGFAGVAVNVTAQQLASRGFVDATIDLLAARALPAGILQIEITEHALVDGSPSVIQALHELRSAGVAVGLDDFGTGYSSLSYLRRLPVDFVKIDQSFMADFGGGSENAAIVAAIIDLSHTLGLRVVAEGVETQAQLRLLESLRCDRGQGYLFARPGPSQMIDALVFAGSGLLPPMERGRA